MKVEVRLLDIESDIKLKIKRTDKLSFKRIRLVYIRNKLKFIINNLMKEEYRMSRLA
jgi:hypothetical protein